MIILLTQYVGLVWNPRYTSICLSFGNGLYTTWHITAIVEHKSLRPNPYSTQPHTLSAYSSWSVYIFAYQISETDCYLAYLYRPSPERETPYQ